MVTRTTASAAPPDPPLPFRIERAIALGHHAILDVFPGLDRLPIAKRVESDARQRKALFRETAVQVIAGDVWMYVAPKALPPGFRRRWKPVVAPDEDCIVVGRKHLSTSPALTVYMDIYHELCHVRQRREGANLWEPGVGYVERWTEIEAYRVVVEDARRLGASESFLREYLEVEWINRREHADLLRKLGVALD
ncbi:MAG: hypothetical protein ACREB9_05355 [Thermoplasmata archaeon]